MGFQTLLLMSFNGFQLEVFRVPGFAVGAEFAGNESGKPTPCQDCALPSEPNPKMSRTGPEVPRAWARTVRFRFTCWKKRGRGILQK